MSLLITRNFWKGVFSSLFSYFFHLKNTKQLFKFHFCTLSSESGLCNFPFLFQTTRSSGHVFTCIYLYLPLWSWSRWNVCWFVRKEMSLFDFHSLFLMLLRCHCVFSYFRGLCLECLKHSVLRGKYAWVGIQLSVPMHGMRESQAVSLLPPPIHTSRDIFLNLTVNLASCRFPCSLCSR